jgi:ribonuclease P protein component
MLPRSVRLKNPISFHKAFRYGKPFFFGNIGCRILFSHTSDLKIGFAVRKKMFRLAVQRNRARRILSEATLSALDSFPENAHLVIFFRSRPERIDLSDLKRDISGLVRIVSGK